MHEAADLVRGDAFRVDGLGGSEAPDQGGEEQEGFHGGVGNTINL